MVTKKQFIKRYTKTSYEMLQEQNPTPHDMEIAKDMAETYWEENEDEIKRKESGGKVSNHPRRNTFNNKFIKSLG